MHGTQQIITLKLRRTYSSTLLHAVGEKDEGKMGGGVGRGPVCTTSVVFT